MLEVLSELDSNSTCLCYANLSLCLPWWREVEFINGMKSPSFYEDSFG